MEKLKVWMEAVLETIQENIDNPGIVIVGAIVLAGFIIRYCQILKKKTNKIKRFTRKRR